MNSSALAWRTSSYSGTNGGECVQVAYAGQHVLIRDSKYLRSSANDPAAQPTVTVAAADWPAFLAVADGAEPDAWRDLPTITWHDSGAVSVTAVDTTLTFTAAEWVAFTAGVRDGEFAAA